MTKQQCVTQYITFILLTRSLAAKIEFTALAGQAVALPCSSSAAMNDTGRTATLIRWYHPRFHRPVYTLDLRTFQLNAHPVGESNPTAPLARHFPSPDVDGRVYLDVTSLPVVLHIDPVVAHDAGRYMCRTDFKRSRSEIEYVYLGVIEPVKKLVVTDGTGRKLEGVIGPYNLGDDVNITCEGMDGNPPPEVFWLKKKHNENEDSDKTDPSLNKSTINIKDVSRSDQWDSYTCIARNNELTPVVSTTVILEINLPPDNLSLNVTNDTLHPGDSIALTCHSTGSHPRAHIEWTQNGVAIPSRQSVMEAGHVTVSSITFPVTLADDGAVLECAARNPSVPDVVLKRSHVFRVRDRAVYRFRDDMKPQPVESGRNVSIECKSGALSTIGYRTKWIFNGTQLLNITALFAVSKLLHEALIRNFQAQVYDSDVAKHYNGEIPTDLQKLRHPSKCRKMERSLQDGGRTDVTCSLDARATDVTLHWSVRDSLSNQTRDSDRTAGASAKLKHGLMPELEILCRGRNAASIREQPGLTIIVLPFVEKRPFDTYLLIAGLLATATCLVSVLVVGRNFVCNRRTVSKESEKLLHDSKGGKSRRSILSCLEKEGNQKEIHCTTELYNQNLSEASRAEHRVKSHSEANL